MTSQPVPPTSSSTTARRWLAVLAGLLLLLPAAVCCGSTLAAPTVQTFQLSLQAANGLGAARFVGGENFTHLATTPSVSKAAAFTLEIIGLRVLVVAIVPVLLALAAGALNGWVRGGLRLVFTLPLALFAPTGLAVAWFVARAPGNNALASAAGAQATILFLDSTQILGLACGVGLIIYLAAQRVGVGVGSRAQSSHTRGPLLLAWFLSLLAAAASGAQVFVLPYLLTRGGPALATTTLALAQFNLAFVNLQLGLGAAVAVLSLAPLLVLGFLAGLLVVVTGARLDSVAKAQPGTSPLPAVLAATLTVVVGVAAFGLWLSGQAALFQAAALALSGGAQTQARGGSPGASLVGPLAVLVLQLPLAYLGALGISAARPLGRWSEWLLLPFSPWLFVTAGPLSIAAWMNQRQLGQVNTLTGLASPILVSVPMLFVLALFFRGRGPRWRMARAQGQSVVGAFLGAFILPSLPLALLLGVLGMLASGQELLWPLIAANRPELFTNNVALAAQLGQLAGRPAQLAGGVVTAVLPGFVLGLLTLGLLQIFFVGRLALRTGSEDEARPGA